MRAYCGPCVFLNGPAPIPSPRAMQAERHDLIVPVVPDVGAAQPGDSIALAPVARNRFGLDAEGPVLLGNVAAPPQSQSRPPTGRASCRESGCPYVQISMVARPIK